MPSAHRVAPSVGLMFANGGRSAQPDHAVAVVRTAESLGFDSVWAVQHVVMPVSQTSTYPYSAAGTIPGGNAIEIPDPLIWLAWAGAQTTRIRLATGVLLLAQQHPLVVAKQAATLDRLCGGRFVLGIGAGWQREEFNALDADFGNRGERLAEAVQILRLAWSPGPAEFHGRHWSFGPVHVEPKPAGWVPIVIGGHTPASARRAGLLADGYFPLACQGDKLRGLIREMTAAANAAGRDSSAIEITASAPRSSADAAVQSELGVARIVVEFPNVDKAELRRALARRLAALRAADHEPDRGRA